MKRVLVATLVAGSAAFLAPAPASAVCWPDPFYEVTGYCTPCQLANAGLATANDASEYATGQPLFAPLMCSGRLPSPT